MMTEVLARAAVHDTRRRTAMRPAVPLILAGLLFGLLASVFPSLPAGAAPPSCLVQEGQAIGAVRLGMDLPEMLRLMGSPIGQGAGGQRLRGGSGRRRFTYSLGPSARLRWWVARSGGWPPGTGPASRRRACVSGTARQGCGLRTTAPSACCAPAPGH